MKYFHNPKCSKSRKGLEEIKKTGLKVEIIEYLKKPIDPKTIEIIYNATLNDSNSLIRKKDAQKIGVTANTKKDILKALTLNPSLLERPILLTEENKAIIGRPTKALIEFLNKNNG